MGPSARRENYGFNFHRALAPFAAIWSRLFSGSAAALARPPLRPSVTAAAFLTTGGSVFGRSPMDYWKTWWASGWGRVAVWLPCHQCRKLSANRKGRKVQTDPLPLLPQSEPRPSGSVASARETPALPSATPPVAPSRSRLRKLPERDAQSEPPSRSRLGRCPRAHPGQKTARSSLE